MLEFFRMAEATRLPELRNVPLTELMKSAAEEAGWHLEYVENLQSKTKFQVRYEKPFSSVVVAELACRMKPAVMSFLSKREIDPGTIDSYVGYGFFNFIKTYKPDVLDTDEKIKQAIYRSVQNKVDQGNRKEIFKFRPGYGKSYIDEDGEEVLSKSSKKYNRTPREISYNSPVFGKDGAESGELGDFIPDNSYSPLTSYIEQEDKNELPNEFGATKEIEKICIEILIEAGAHGKITLKDLKKEVAIRINPNVEDLFLKLEIMIDEGRKEEAERFEKEVLNKEIGSLNRTVKTFYRKLKVRLAEKYHI